MVLKLDILVYGHGDKSAEGFQTDADFKEYIKSDIFQKEAGRYRYSQKKHADIIVLSRDGFAFGHFIVASMEDPNEHDRQSYPPVKHVYNISKSFLYEQKVHLSAIGISKYQFGKYLTEQEFNEIQSQATVVDEFSS